MKRKRGRERKGKRKESNTVSGGESTSGRERRGSGRKVEERQQAEVTRRVAGADALYIDPPSDKPPI
jgi:hypothetical protein